MSNISEQYRKPLMSDETGKAIAEKLGGDSVSTESLNISEQYRRPLMSEETAQAILEKIGGGSGGDSGTAIYEALFDSVDGAGWSNFSFTNDVTVKDVIDSIKDGKEVILKVQTTENNNSRIYLRYKNQDFNTTSNKNSYKFEYLTSGKNGNLLSSCYVSLSESDDSDTGFKIYGDAIKGVFPDANSTKNGEVLMIIDGRYNLTTINQLPNVTSDDNGKTVQVVNGAWEKVNDRMVVHFTEDALGNVTSDKTFQQILTAYDNDVIITASLDTSRPSEERSLNPDYLPLSYVNRGNQSETVINTFSFSTYTVGDGEIYFISIKIHDNNSIIIEEQTVVAS